MKSGSKVGDRRPVRRQVSSAGRSPRKTSPRPIVVDRYRQFVFPNHVRALRRANGFPKLLGLAAKIPEISYIRLSKIERGEIVARPDELGTIAAALKVEPAALLLDPDDPSFDIADWAAPFVETARADEEDERLAVLLGAAVRERRASDPSLTIAALEQSFGIPPVILSRIEHAQKPLARWNARTVEALCRLLGVKDEKTLRVWLERRYRSGALDDHLAAVSSPDARIQRSRERIAALAAELAGVASAAPADPLRDAQAARPRSGSRQPSPPRQATVPVSAGTRLLAVIGSPLPGGLIAPTPCEGIFVEAPSAAGANAFGLRVCRPTLGGGLPGSSIVVVDPERFPSSGGLAAVREQGNYRLLSVTFDRTGAMRGYSVHPDLEVELDALDPADVAAVVSAVFV